MNQKMHYTQINYEEYFRYDCNKLFFYLLEKSSGFHQSIFNHPIQDHRQTLINAICTMEKDTITDLLDGDALHFGCSKAVITNILKGFLDKIDSYFLITIK